MDIIDSTLVDFEENDLKELWDSDYYADSVKEEMIDDAMEEIKVDGEDGHEWSLQEALKVASEVDWAGVLEGGGGAVGIGGGGGGGGGGSGGGGGIGVVLNDRLMTEASLGVIPQLTTLGGFGGFSSLLSSTDTPMDTSPSPSSSPSPHHHHINPQHIHHHHHHHHDAGAMAISTTHATTTTTALSASAIATGAAAEVSNNPVVKVEHSYSLTSDTSHPHSPLSDLESECFPAIPISEAEGGCSSRSSSSSSSSSCSGCDDGSVSFGGGTLAEFTTTTTTTTTATTTTTTTSTTTTTTTTASVATRYTTIITDTGGTTTTAINSNSSLPSSTSSTSHSTPCSTACVPISITTTTSTANGSLRKPNSTHSASTCFTPSSTSPSSSTCSTPSYDIISAHHTLPANALLAMPSLKTSHGLVRPSAVLVTQRSAGSAHATASRLGLSSLTLRFPPSSSSSASSSSSSPSSSSSSASPSSSTSPSSSDTGFYLPPTPPSCSSSDSECGSQSPTRTPPLYETLTPQFCNTRKAATRVTVSRNPINTPLISTQPKGATGAINLTEEEKRTLLSEGYNIPSRLPLTKAEEKSLKKIRRKIKNKISAQESRRKKKDYMDALERKVDKLSSENIEYKRRIEMLQTSNSQLLVELQQLQCLVEQDEKYCLKSSPITTFLS